MPLQEIYDQESRGRDLRLGERWNRFQENAISKEMGKSAHDVSFVPSNMGHDLKKKQQHPNTTHGSAIGLPIR